MNEISPPLHLWRGAWGEVITPGVPLPPNRQQKNNNTKHNSLIINTQI